MKTSKWIIGWSIVFLTWVSVCEAENWEKYFSNRAGYDFFIEKDTLVRLKKKEVQVWHKSCPSEGQIGAWDEWSELRLVDCAKKRYKVLQGKIYSKDKVETLTRQSTWTYLEPGSIYESFYSAVCEKK